jgi:hypothetical protein
VRPRQPAADRGKVEPRKGDAANAAIQNGRAPASSDSSVGGFFMPRHLHPTDPAFECRAATAIDSFFIPLRDTDIVVAFAIGTDLDQLDLLFEKLDIRKGWFDKRWLSGFFLRENGRRDYRALIMVRGRRSQITATIRAFNRTAKIAGYVVAAADRSYEVFRAGEYEPFETGPHLTLETIEIAYSKLTNEKQRLALANAYTSYDGYVVRNALRRFGYL